MARRSLPTPIQLQRRAFKISEGFDAGMTAGQLRHPRFDKPHHGVRVVSTADPPPEFPINAVFRSAASYLPILRETEAFSHTSALLLLGAPLRTDLQLHVTVAKPSGPARGRNVSGHNCKTPFARVLAASKYPCVPPLMALEQVMNTLDFRELIVAIDYLVSPAFGRNHPNSVCGLDELRSRATELSSRGIRRLRAALTIANVGAESRMETLTRFELAVLGFDEFELQSNVFDSDGSWIGRFDFVDHIRKLIIEYDGEQHRLDRAQYLRDQDRIGRAWSAGYRVLRLVKEDFRHAQRHSLRQRLCDFLGRPAVTPHPLLQQFAAAYL